MSLTAEDVKEIHTEILIKDEFLECLSTFTVFYDIRRGGYGLRATRKAFAEQIEKEKKTRSELSPGPDIWYVEQYQIDRLVELREALFCSLEEVPEHMGSKRIFICKIAAWRLEHGR